jgi:hypothetical protein
MNSYEQALREFHRRQAALQETNAAQNAQRQNEEQQEREAANAQARDLRLEKEQAIANYRKEISILIEQADERRAKVRALEHFSGSLEDFELQRTERYQNRGNPVAKPVHPNSIL